MFPGLPIEPGEGSLAQPSTAAIPEPSCAPLAPRGPAHPQASLGLPGRVPRPDEAVDTEASGMGTALFQSHEIPVGTARPFKLRQIRGLRQGLQI